MQGAHDGLFQKETGNAIYVIILNQDLVKCPGRRGGLRSPEVSAFFGSPRRAERARRGRAGARTATAEGRTAEGHHNPAEGRPGRQGTERGNGARVCSSRTVRAIRASVASLTVAAWPLIRASVASLCGVAFG